MEISTTIKKYREEANFFAPDYQQENETLLKFKEEHPTLTASEVETFKQILETSNDWSEKFFVADLLYLYSNFDRKLLNPLIESAISFSDPSLNRVFLRPCLRVFGIRQVSDILAEKFISSDIVRKISISTLVYWLERDDNREIRNLEEAIVDRSYKTDNIIELYHYNLYFPNKVALDKKIPLDAAELINRIQGNQQLEELLFNELGWAKMNGS